MFELPADFAHLRTWTREQINGRLAEIGADDKVLTDEQRAEIHALKLALPPNGVLVAEAKQRVQERVGERVAKRRARDDEAAREFMDTEWMPALEKARVLRDMTSLLELVVRQGTGKEIPSAFTTRLYGHIMQNCGHIAHFDRDGFWHAQLSTAKKAMAFFEGMADDGLIQWTVPDFKDLNTAIVRTVKSRMAELHQALWPRIQADALNAIEVLAMEAGLEVSACGRTLGKTMRGRAEGAVKACGVATKPPVRQAAGGAESGQGALF